MKMWNRPKLSKAMFSIFNFECQIKNWQGERKFHW
jgi:hypothetical protein